MKKATQDLLSKRECGNAEVLDRGSGGKASKNQVVKNRTVDSVGRRG